VNSAPESCSEWTIRTVAAQQLGEDRKRGDLRQHLELDGLGDLLRGQITGVRQHLLELPGQLRRLVSAHGDCLRTLRASA
jgi:hypothetical protein